VELTPGFAISIEDQFSLIEKIVNPCEQDSPIVESLMEVARRDDHGNWRPGMGPMTEPTIPFAAFKHMMFEFGNPVFESTNETTIGFLDGEEDIAPVCQQLSSRTVGHFGVACQMASSFGINLRKVHVLEPPSNSQMDLLPSAGDSEFDDGDDAE
jgi:hypothetical protein